jgi:hypothetical protein
VSETKARAPSVLSGTSDIARRGGLSIFLRLSRTNYLVDKEPTRGRSSTLWSANAEQEPDEHQGFLADLEEFVAREGL